MGADGNAPRALTSLPSGTVLQTAVVGNTLKIGGRGRILTYVSSGLQPEPLSTLVPDHKTLEELRGVEPRFQG